MMGGWYGRISGDICVYLAQRNQFEKRYPDTRRSAVFRPIVFKIDYAGTLKPIDKPRLRAYFCLKFGL